MSYIFLILGTINDWRRRFTWWVSDTLIHRATKSTLATTDRDLARNLRVALVCIAKDEENYIDEWIQYHLKLGVDDVFIYQNNWRYKKSLNSSSIHLIDFDGEARQLPAYNKFISDHGSKFDFAIFIDVDEFICLVQDVDIKIFLTRYINHNAVALNWRYFGDSGHSCVVNGNFSLLQRFTRCGTKLNRHVKTIVNLRKAGTSVRFSSPHYLAEAFAKNFTIAVDGKSFVRGPFLYRHNYKLAWINHYYSKTLQEFLNHKQFRGRSDLFANDKNQVYQTKTFYKCNQNDITNLIAFTRYKK